MCSVKTCNVSDVILDCVSALHCALVILCYELAPCSRYVFRSICTGLIDFSALSL